MWWSPGLPSARRSAASCALAMVCLGAACGTESGTDRLGASVDRTDSVEGPATGLAGSPTSRSSPGGVLAEYMAENRVIGELLELAEAVVYDSGLCYDAWSQLHDLSTDPRLAIAISRTPDPEVTTALQELVPTISSFVVACVDEEDNRADQLGARVNELLATVEARVAGRPTPPTTVPGPGPLDPKSAVELTSIGVDDGAAAQVVIPIGCTFKPDSPVGGPRPVAWYSCEGLDSTEVSAVFRNGNPGYEVINSAVSDYELTLATMVGGVEGTLWIRVTYGGDDHSGMTFRLSA